MLGEADMPRADPEEEDGLPSLRSTRSGGSSSSEEDDVLELKCAITRLRCMLDFPGMGLEFHALTMPVPVEGQPLGGKPDAEVQSGKSPGLCCWKMAGRAPRPSMKNALQSG
jgi:hypothetical protein